ncbi:MAG TPA: isoprenylcysteine carboxylmethyltransferase family protein [Bacteroidales bacterium]|nr:isoprenylcysteine carboxylmethyltransferase family protein [Bacteroidales bacterium]
MLTKISSSLGFVIAALGMSYLLVNHYVIAGNSLVIIIQVLAFCLMIWARITFRGRSFHISAKPTDGGLVTSGPYRWLRHPIYAAVIYFSWACLGASPKPEVLAAVALITFGLFVRMILEERELRKIYPEYAEYAKRTKRLVPLVF